MIANGKRNAFAESVRHIQKHQTKETIMTDKESQAYQQGYLDGRAGMRGRDQKADVLKRELDEQRDINEALRDHIEILESQLAKAEAASRLRFEECEEVGA